MQNEKLKSDKPNFLHFLLSWNLNVPCSSAAMLLFFCDSRQAGMTTTSVQQEEKSQFFNIFVFAEVLIL